MWGNGAERPVGWYRPSVGVPETLDGSPSLLLKRKLNCLLLTVGMKRAAAAALTGHAPKRQKLHRTNLTPGQGGFI